jgi:hypothetical protein
VSSSQWRFSARTIARTIFALTALSALACSDRDASGPRPANQARIVGMAPRFALVPGGPSITLSRVEAWLTGATDSVFSKANFAEGSATLHFEIPIVGESAEFVLDLTGFDVNGVAVYHARQTYTLRPGDNTDLAAPELVYSAPDAAVVSIFVNPSETTIDVGSTGTLSVVGYGAGEDFYESVNVGWTSRNTAVATVNAQGVVTGVARGQTYIVARTATDIADSALVTVQGFALLPEKVEKLPNGTQQFLVTAGKPPYTWTVNGVAGGNATFGTITAQGFYTAPPRVPSPSTFDVCVAQASPQASACSAVTINPVPTSGADVIVFNDINFMDLNFGAANTQLFINLAQFTSVGPRNSQKAFMMFRGHQSKCAVTGECSASSFAPFYTALASVNIPIVDVDDMAAMITTIPSTIKTIMLLNPTTPFTNAEMNVLKQFSAEGGRIIFVGEHAGYYGDYIETVENDFLGKMGAVLRNPGTAGGSGVFACSATVTGSDIRPHQVTTNVTSVAFACSTEVILGPNDYALMTIQEENALRVLAAVAKVDLTPLPPDEPNRLRSLKAQLNRAPAKADPEMHSWGRGAPLARP